MKMVDLSSLIENVSVSPVRLYLHVHALCRVYRAAGASRKIVFFLNSEEGWGRLHALEYS